MNVPKIRGLIAEHYKNPNAMANSMGWNPQRLYRILEGKQKATTEDVFAMAKALGILESYEDVVSIFIA